MNIKTSKPVAPKALPDPPDLAKSNPVPSPQLDEPRAPAHHDYPQELAWIAAGACELVYQPFSKIQSTLWFSGIRDVVTFDCCGSQAIGFMHGGDAWLVFRGSESAPETELFLDWGTDLLCIPWGLPPRHLGFALAWGRVRKPIFEWINSLQDGTPLVITGHSLGGALAQLAANEIAQQNAAPKNAEQKIPALKKVVPIAAVITFGSPKVGFLYVWTWFYHRRPSGRFTEKGEAIPLRDVTWRVENNGDLVTYVPFWPFFNHAGRAETACSHPEPASLSLPATPLGRMRETSQKVRAVWPYSLLHLLFDLILSLIETAPQHFIRHYGNAFPGRPFSSPVSSPSGPKSPLNKFLALVKWMIVGGIVYALYLLMKWAYLTSPEATGIGIIYFVAYAIFGNGRTTAVHTVTRPLVQPGTVFRPIKPEPAKEISPPDPGTGEK